MKTRIRSLILLAFLLSVPLSHAQGLLEKLSKQRPQTAVNDYANVMSPSQRGALESQLVDLERKTRVAIVVVVLPSLDGGEINDFATRLYEAWGIGQKGEDKGVLFLAAMRDRKLRIEVGYGLEGLLPDSKCGRILDEAVVPSFKAGRHAAGIMGGALTLAQIVAKDAGVPFSSQIPGRSRSRQGSQRPKGSPIFTIIMLIIMIPIIIRNPWLLLFLMSSGGGYHRGGFGGGGGGFGGFGGGMSGGGGASRGW